MLTARAFWTARRSAGLFSGVGPPAFTAIAISLPIRWKAFDIRSQRANIVLLRVSKMRPMAPILADRQDRADAAARAQVGEALLDRGEWAARGDQALEIEPARLPERDEPRDVAQRVRATERAAEELLLLDHEDRRGRELDSLG